jgi:hemoglobin
MFKNISIVLILTILTSPIHAGGNGAFKAFGEKQGLTKLVDDLMVEFLADKRMRPFFKNSNHKRVKEKLVEQFCKELGGGCEYTGQNMYRAHKGHSIKAADFYALVEVLQKVMRQHKIPNWAQNKLLAKLAPMHKEVINE